MPWLAISIVIAGCMIAYSIALRGFNIASVRRSKAERPLNKTYEDFATDEPSVIYDLSLLDLWDKQRPLVSLLLERDT